jgi:hypothetical protein
MIRPEIENYMRETSRVLKSGGKVFATFFILNDLARHHMAKQKFRFDHQRDGSFLMDKAVRSANVAYDESDLLSILQKHGFRIIETHYGTWSGRSTDTLDFQDIIVLEKEKD